MSLELAIVVATINGDKLAPKLTDSLKYKHWISIKDNSRCVECKNKHGKIYLITEEPNQSPPIHRKCRCFIKPMQAIEAGTATIYGINGADWNLVFKGQLPDYYISKEQAEMCGWKSGKWLSNFALNKVITKGQYYNDDARLPQAEGRIWHEADINYKTGRRNNQRILWSNDGLIFVTYDHYKTFYEII